MLLLVLVAPCSFDITLPNCYSVGGFLFVFGSALLVSATVGPLPKTLSDVATVSFLRSLLGKGWSLFWGSLAFLVGSCIFTHDSFNSSPKNAIVGYAFFVIGRLYFLWGSSTEEVDLLLRTKERRRLRSLSIDD